MSWAAQQNITLRFIQPGKPQQDACIERYNRTVRYDWLGQHLFSTLNELQDYATRWQWFLITNVRNGIDWLHTHAAYSAYGLILHITFVKNRGIIRVP